jgi:hypothetical protein
MVNFVNIQLGSGFTCIYTENSVQYYFEPESQWYSYGIFFAFLTVYRLCVIRGRSRSTVALFRPRAFKSRGRSAWFKKHALFKMTKTMGSGITILWSPCCTHLLFRLFQYERALTCNGSCTHFNYWRKNSKQQNLLWTSLCGNLDTFTV